MRVRLKNDKLAEILSRSPFSQNHWALKLGLSKGHVADLVNGKHPYPSPETREKILRGLGVAFEDLFEIVEPHDGVDETLDLKARFQSSLANRYVIDDVIGQGGMGTVYLARDVRHGRQVAIKVVLPDSIGAMGNHAFLKEIRLTASLQHPNIVTLLDSGEEAGCPYLVAPYVTGGSLRDLMEKHGPFEPKDALRIIEGICEALQYAHDRQTIHCDIKPENVLVSSGRAMITDFGISRAIHLEGHSWRAGIDTSSGTPVYVSPEQASGETAIGTRTDQYSVACLLYEMLSGEPPFSGENDMAVISQRFLGEAPDVSRVAPGVPWAVAATIRKAMAIDPRRRHGSMNEFLKELKFAVSTGTQTAGEWIDNRLTALAHSAHRIAVAVLGVRSVDRIAGAWQRLGGAKRRAYTGFERTRGMKFFGSLRQDVGYAFRTLRKRPGFTSVMVVSLALGVGVNSAMFSIVNAVLLKPLPYPDPASLLYLSEGTTDGRSGNAFAYPNLRDVMEQTTALSAVTAFLGGMTSVGGGATPVFAPTYFVAPNYFAVFGTPPLMGSTQPADPAATYAVLSHSMWQTAFGSDPEILGKTILVDGSPIPVAAVMDRAFAFPRGASVWVAAPIYGRFGSSRTAHNLQVIGRLNAGMTLETARADLSRIARSVVAENGNEVSADLNFAAESLHEHLSGDHRSTLLLLEIVVGVILLIACGNLASIQMSQSLSRTREIALRRSVGATTGRLISQLLTESTLLGIAGAVAGLALAWISLGTINTVIPAAFLHSGAIAIDGNVVLFTLVLGAGTGVLFGLVPAWKSTRHSPQDALRAGENSAPGGATGRRSGGLLVVPQYAFSLTALVAAGLVVKSLFTLVSVDPGFNPANLLTLELNLPTSPPSRYASRDAISQFHDELLRRVSQLPGVVAVTLDNAPPLATGGYRVNGGARTEEMPDGEWPLYPDWRIVGPNFFATLGTGLIAGRDILASDINGAEPVVVVNQTFAQRAWGDRDPLGRSIRLSSLDNNREEATRWLRVVGVVPDFHSHGLDAEVKPAVFAPVSQHMDRASGVDLLIDVDGDPREVLGTIREIVADIDPMLPIGRAMTLDGWAHESTAEPRFRAGLLMGLGGLALALALLGVYGVMSHSVSRRRKEMAVRLALGAERSGILSLLAREALWFVLAGQVLGTVLVFFTTRVMAGMLFGVSVNDPGVYGAVSLVLAAVVLLTTLIPAYEAGKVHPAEVLKE